MDKATVLRDVGVVCTYTGTAEGGWSRGGKPPPVSQRKKGGDKDVFKFLRSQDPNFTIRRQQQHISRIFEKHQALKTASGRGSLAWWCDICFLVFTAGRLW